MTAWVSDASFLNAVLDSNDQHHAAALQDALTPTRDLHVVHAITMAEILVGGVRIGRGAALQDDLRRSGVTVASPVPDESLRLAELRVSTSLRLPDCCPLLTALTSVATLRTFDVRLASAARQLGVPVGP